MCFCEVTDIYPGGPHFSWIPWYGLAFNDIVVEDRGRCIQRGWVRNFVDEGLKLLRIVSDRSA
jgi:hypothetical protein